MSNRDRRGPWTPNGAELFGIILIVAGVLAFLGAVNAVRISWGVIWPILLIGVGAIVVLSAVRPGGDRAGTVQLAAGATRQLELDILIGGGTFRVAGDASGMLTVRSNRDDITVSEDRAGERARIRLRQDARWFPLAGGSYSEWDIRVAGDLPTALTIQGGAGTFDVDLSTIRIVDAQLTFGAAQVRIALPRPQGDIRVRISSGAASVDVRVPAGVEASLSTSGLVRLEGRTETPGYRTAVNRVTVAVSGGASTVRIV